MKIFTYILFAALIAVVYLPMVAPSVAPQGDSGELVTAAYFLGVAHPPGYPLYTLLGYLFTKLPWGEVAWRVNLMSTVFHLASLALIVAIIKKITSDWVPAVGTALILAFSYNFWLYSLVAEVFPMNNLLALICLLLAVDIYFQKKVVTLRRKIFWLAFLFGLGLANHQTIVFLAVPILILLWPILRRNFGKVVPGIGAGILGLLLPYVFLFVRAKFFPPTPGSWVFPDSLPGIVNLFFRGDYGTFAPTAGVDPSLALISEKADHVVNYLRFALDDFGWVGMGLAITGAIFGWRKYRRITLAMISGFLVTSVVFLSYANFPYREASGTGLEIIERFYLLPNLFFVLLIGISLSVIFTFVRKVPIARLLYGPLLAFYLLGLFVNHYPLVNQQNNYLAADLGKNILVGAAPNSLIVLQGDVPTFASFYQHYVQGVRPDIEFLTPNQVSRYNRYRYLKLVRPELNLTLPEAASPGGILRMNPGTGIYSVGHPSFPISGYIASPSGLLFEVKTPEQVEDFSIWQQNSEAALANYHLPTSRQVSGVTTLADMTVYFYYDRMFTALGDFCRFNNHTDCAEKYYLAALHIDPRDLIAVYGLGQAYEKSDRCLLARDEYQKFITLAPESERGYAYLEDLALNCFRDEEMAKQYGQVVKQKQQLRKNTLENL